MNPSNRLLLALFLIVVPFVGILAQEEKPKSVKVPDPSKVLKKATRSLTKATNRDGFQLSLLVQGGTSVTADHAIARPSVMHKFDADVAHGTMKVDHPDAFRTVKGTALRTAGQLGWRPGSATKEGAILQHFLAFPHVLLKNIQQRPDDIRWIWIGDELEKEPVEDKEEEEAEGHTVVVKRKEQQDESKAMPYAMRIDLAKKTAGDQWNEIVKTRIFDHGAG